MIQVKMSENEETKPFEEIMDELSEVKLLENADLLKELNDIYANLDNALNGLKEDQKGEIEERDNEIKELEGKLDAKQDRILELERQVEDFKQITGMEE